jgi:ABC-2 type transport system permease protein
MSWLRVCRYGFIVGWKEWTDYWGWKSWLGGWLVRMVAQALFFVLLGELLDSPDRLRFLLIGNVVAIGVVSSWAVPASTWDRYDGTYPLLVVSPTSLLLPIVGRTSIWLLNSIASSLLTFAILLVAFNLDVPAVGVLLSLPFIILSAAGYYCMSLLFGSLITKAPRFRNLVNNLATGCIVAFCGVNLPLDFWPQPIEALANLVPMTHTLQAVRVVLDEGPLVEAAASGLLGLACMTAWLLAAVLTIDRMANSGRANGSIEFA